MSRGTPLSTQIIFAETQRDKALAVLGEKDDEIARLREELAKHRHRRNKFLLTRSNANDYSY